jgi:DNA-binding NtrC family response regulator
MKEHLPGELSKSSSRDMTQSEYAPMQRIEDFICTSLGNKNINEIMDAFEKILINKALEHCQGNKLQAAQLLGLSRPGLYKKLQKHSGESDDSG